MAQFTKGPDRQASKYDGHITIPPVLRYALEIAVGMRRDEMRLDETEQVQEANRAEQITG